MCFAAPKIPNVRPNAIPAPPEKTQARPLRPFGLEEAQVRASRLGTSQLRIPLTSVNLPQ